jgi:hypothetical protein
LAPVMSLAAVSFLIAAAVWWSLPETVKRREAA